MEKMDCPVVMSLQRYVVDREATLGGKNFTLRARAYFVPLPDRTYSRVTPVTRRSC
jgi:hypothetical protein